MPANARSSTLTLLLAPSALIVGLWLGGGAAQGQAAGPTWQYRTEPWTVEDTTAVLRAVTGDQLSSVDDMAQSLSRGTELVDDPRLQSAVLLRLQERLVTLGDAGWEVFWLSEARAVVGGVLLPAPVVHAKRRG